MENMMIYECILRKLLATPIIPIRKNLQIAIAVDSGAWTPHDTPFRARTQRRWLRSEISRLGRWDRLRVSCPQHFSILIPSGKLT